MTDKAQYTPGPWHVGENGLVIGPEGEHVGATRFWEYNQESDPNARLIAAAPELLEIVQALKVWYDAATDGAHVNQGPSADSLLFDNEDSLHDRINSAIAKAEGRDR